MTATRDFAFCLQPGGKLTTNKHEAIDLFIERKRISEGGLSAAEEERIRASLNLRGASAAVLRPVETDATDTPAPAPVAARSGARGRNGEARPRASCSGAPTKDGRNPAPAPAGGTDQASLPVRDRQNGGAAASGSGGVRKGAKVGKFAKSGVRRRLVMLKPAVLCMLRTSASCAFLRRPLLHPRMISMMRKGKRAGDGGTAQMRGGRSQP